MDSMAKLSFFFLVPAALFVGSVVRLVAGAL